MCARNASKSRNRAPAGGQRGARGSGATITTGALVQEMIDLRRLTDFPRRPGRIVLFSSYDRAASLPGGPGWFSNNVGFGAENTPNFVGVVKKPDASGVGEYLVCDVRGPGAILRTWTAGPEDIKGDLRVYLDGARQPLYEGDAAQFLLCPYVTFLQNSGLKDAVVRGAFVQNMAAYCPIPFAKRLRIIWTGRIPDKHFYEVTVRLYEPGTPVKTFAPEDLRTYAAQFKAVGRVLADPQGQYRYRSTMRSVRLNDTVGPGEAKEMLRLKGPQALERLTLKLSAADLDLALRQTILHVICDEYPWGQVQAPVGDFFGAAPGVNPFDSLAMTVLPDGTMTCRFIMPFERSLRIVLDNRGAQPVAVTGDALPMRYPWNAETAMHFRARWRVNHDVTGDARDAAQDMPLLIAGGRGLYVGSAVFLLNPCAVPTPWGSWWGEADEKVFIDDDTFPSCFGTGSEDYFNYTWSSPDIFWRALCGQPRNDGPGNRGFVANFRWHIPDPLPFTRRIAFYLQLWTHERTPGMSYARIAYHYARPGIFDDHLPITNENLRLIGLPPGWQPAARKGAANTTFHEPEELVQPGASVTSETGNPWSGGRLLVWQPKSLGDELRFRLPVVESGRCAIVLGAALDARAGVLKACLDGTSLEFNGTAQGAPPAPALNLHEPHRVQLRHYDSVPLELTQGAHTLTLRCEALSPLGGPTAFGIDYLGVQRK